jgi:two-component system cell cycle response regulator
MAIEDQGTETRGSVLVVDDSRVVRAVVAQHLRRAGYEVEQADGGEAAMRLLATGRYDVMITDLRMPGMDGMQVLAATKQRAIGTEVIILTGTYAHDMTFAVRALRLGAHDYLTKPIAQPDELVLTVERAVEKKRLRDANARLMRELEALSRTDALTGVGNRRAFDETLRQEHARAVRYGLPLALVLFDLDHFKKLNDAHGHAAGDAALRAFARLARATYRESDTLCRYGGEEFAALLPHTAPEGAADAARRLLAALASTPIPAGGATLSLTCSAGVASAAPGETASDLIARADAALYRAKREGRNRVMVDQARPARVLRLA